MSEKWRFAPSGSVTQQRRLQCAKNACWRGGGIALLTCKLAGSLATFNARVHWKDFVKAKEFGNVLFVWPERVVVERTRRQGDGACLQDGEQSNAR